MKLVSFSKDNAVRAGIFNDSGIIDIRSAWPEDNPPKSVLEILNRGDECLDKLKEISTTDFIPPDFVQLLAPVPRPPKILALAGNYTKHIEEAGKALGLSPSPRNTTVPRPFIMPGTVATGTKTVIPWPAYSDQVDYELELAIVIGKPCRCVSIADAENYIAGYTIANDISLEA